MDFETKLSAVIVATVALLILMIGGARANIFDGYAESRTAKTGCLPPGIRAALAKANAACGIKVISTHRPGARIAGTRTPSMHAQCRAADFTTRSPTCVLHALADWRGKLSTDYYRVRHFHIDDGRYARFAHGGRSKRYAKRYGRKVRVARAH